ncbi:MAG: hypothetical protein OJI67_06675 [Prosthecobacter sp.]|nr:hypothetical protein [Prosthecobacter sp.]
MTNRQVKDITPKAWAKTQKAETTGRVALSNLRQPASAGAWLDG